MDRPAFADEEAFVNKLILLYIFDQCNVGLIESVIYDIATSHNWIKPIFCMLCPSPFPNIPPDPMAYSPCMV